MTIEEKNIKEREIALENQIEEEIGDKDPNALIIISMIAVGNSVDNNTSYYDELQKEYERYKQGKY